MIEDILVFEISNKNYAVDLRRLSLNIRANLIFESIEYAIDPPAIVRFLDKIINIIDISQLFEIPQNQIDENSRIITFEKDHKTYGFIVDKIQYLLNVDKTLLKDIQFSLNEDPESILIPITNNDANLIYFINLDKIPLHENQHSQLFFKRQFKHKIDKDIPTTDDHLLDELHRNISNPPKQNGEGLL